MSAVLSEEACLDELLGTLAHELRSPLVTIVSAAQLASECAMEPPARRALAVMERQSRQALGIIDDLFDLCAGAGGKLTLRKEVLDLAELVAAATETAGHLLAARQHRLTVSLPPGPVSLEADPLRLAQVLTNLLGNAAKFTDPGGHIRLTARVEAGQVVLRVRDNGRGIEPDLLPRVFDLFYQVPGPGRQATGGLGLGLALVKSLVELHGGSVAAFSDGLGTGCEFVVSLPACVREASTSRTSRPREWELRINGGPNDEPAHTQTGDAGCATVHARELISALQAGPAAAG